MKERKGKRKGREGEKEHGLRPRALRLSLRTVAYGNGDELCDANTDLYFESKQRVHAFHFQLIDELFVKFILDKWKTLTQSKTHAHTNIL